MGVVEIEVGNFLKRSNFPENFEQLVNLWTGLPPGNPGIPKQTLSEGAGDKWEAPEGAFPLKH